MLPAMTPPHLIWMFALAVLFTPCAYAGEDLVSPEAILEIVEDCQVARNGKTPFIGDIPFIGSALDGALDSVSGGPRKRNQMENECIETKLEARRMENERESEREMDAVRTRCQRTCAPDDDWVDYCREPGVPELPICPKL